MSANHTPGTLSASLAYGGGSAIWISPEAGAKMILQGAQCLRAETVKPEPMDAEQLAANARRMVACWNACDGIDIDLLEGFSPRFLATLPDRHLAQRSELLNALKRLSFAAMARDNTMGDQCGLFAAQAELRDANKLAMKAIAKATGATS